MHYFDVPLTACCTPVMIPVRSIIALSFLLLVASMAHAAGDDVQKEIILPRGYSTVVVGLAKIDDGTVHMLVLATTGVGYPPIPTFCGAGWSNGYINLSHRSPVHNGALIASPGCWAASNDDPKTAIATFRYFSLRPSDYGVKEFSFRLSAFTRLMINDNTGEIFEEQSGANGKAPHSYNGGSKP